MTGSVRALLAQHLPQYEIVSITRLGQGLENVAYLVNSELVVRLGSRGANQGWLLTAVRQWSTLDIPVPVFVDETAGALAYHLIPGEPLLTHPVADVRRLAPVLGEFLSRLHRAPLDGLVPHDDVAPSAWLDEAAHTYQEIAAVLSDAQRRVVERFLTTSPPPAPGSGVFCHNDLGAEHILVDVDTGSIAGVIDWSDAAITDPARDLALIYRDLGPSFVDRVVADYDGRFDDRVGARVRFYACCAALEDIAYGTTIPGARHYAVASLAHLYRTFAA